MNNITTYFKKINKDYTLITSFDSEPEPGYTLKLGEVVVYENPDPTSNEPSKCKVGDGDTKWGDLAWFSDVSSVTASADKVLYDATFINKDGKLCTGEIQSSQIDISGGKLNASVNVDLAVNCADELPLTESNSEPADVFYLTASSSGSSTVAAVTKKCTAGVVDEEGPTEVIAKSYKKVSTTKYYTLPTASIATPEFQIDASTSHQEYPAMKISTQAKIDGSGVILKGSSSPTVDTTLYLTHDSAIQNNGANLISCSMNHLETASMTSCDIVTTPPTIFMYVADDLSASRIKEMMDDIYDKFPHCQIMLKGGTKLAAGMYTFKGYSQTAPSTAADTEWTFFTYESPSYDIHNILNMGSGCYIPIESMYIRRVYNPNTTSNRVDYETEDLSTILISGIRLTAAAQRYEKLHQDLYATTTSTSSDDYYLKFLLVGQPDHIATGAANMETGGTFTGPMPGEYWAHALIIKEDIALPRALGDWILANTTHSRI